MKRILIADDNAMVRRGLRGLRGLIARNDDWQVCGEANDGREAVQRTRELHPDVLVARPRDAWNEWIRCGARTGEGRARSADPAV
jgi:DNA-binding NarL/FixJ family response regulator